MSAYAGRIGKPQKSKRHKKIKPTAHYDPDDFLMAGKQNHSKDWNRPPAKEDEQEIPAGVKRIAKLQEEIKLGVRKKKRGKQGDGDSKIMFKKEKGESDKRFLWRVTKESKLAIAKSQFEAKYDVDVQSVTDGKVQYIKKSSEKNQKRFQVLKEKKKVKKNKHLEEEQMGFNQFTDKVAFGEVAMEPPSFTAKPRKGHGQERRPGKKSLLLKEIIQTNQAQSGSAAIRREVGKTLKRKQMSLAKQKIMDEERTKAIDLYRQMKSKKMKS